MRNRLPFILTLLASAFLPLSLGAQNRVTAYPAGTYDTLRIASYNLLDYPADAATRDPYFRRVVHTMHPDILVVQEMTSQSGVNTFLSDVLNTYQAGLYSTIPFHDGPDTDNHLFFKSSKVTFVGASYLPTALRDIAEYIVQVTSTGDQLRLYSVHLKASQGYESDRLAEATILRNHLNSLPAGTKFIIVGDYNIYTSTEPAFQELIGSLSNNNGRAKDPINAVGNWHDGLSFAAIHTQSPRVRSFGGGATGGMDDRFDIMLTSYSALDENIILSRYTEYGNDGNHFNDSINRLPNSAVPDSVANGLHYASDHIPVFCDYRFGLVLGDFTLMAPSNGSVGEPTSGTLRWHSARNATGYDVYLSSENPPLSKVSVLQADTSYGYGGLPGVTAYYWKVVARSATDSLDAAGSPWQFTTQGPPPGAFLLLLPADGAAGQPVNGTLTWNSSQGATGYDVYMDTVSPPALKVDSNLTDTSRPYSNLQAGLTYYWKVVAKNLSGSTAASNAPRSFTISVTPPAPGNLHAESITSTTIGLAWTDNAVNELGYRVYRSVSAGGPFSQAGGDLAPNTITCSDTGLGVGQRFFYRVVAFNTEGEGNYASLEAASLALRPGIPVLTGVDYTGFTLRVDPAGNPPGVQFAIRIVQNSVEKFVRSDGTLSMSPIWSTYSEWGGAGGLHTSGLLPCSPSEASVKARNADSVETAYGEIQAQVLPCFDVSTAVSSGWNLVSVPVHPGDLRKAVLFPSCVSDAFTYQGSYTSQDTLRVGAGYWMKFPAPEVLGLSGEPAVRDSIRVVTGWNLIGSLADSIDISTVTTEPPGVIDMSSFFGFNGMYVKVDSILPMHGYWVHATNNGKVVLSSVPGENLPRNTLRQTFESLHSFTFEDAAHHSQTLYVGAGGHPSGGALPPLPPEGSFDVRFAGNTYVEELTSARSELQVLIRGAQAPLRVAWKRGTVSETEFSIDDLVHLRVLKGERGADVLLPEVPDKLFLRVLEGSASDGGGELPASFALHQNYPNPFNPSTEIKYDLPVSSRVELTICNVLGAEVARLSSGIQARGSHSVHWQPDLPSGVYFCRMEAVSLEDPAHGAQRTIRLLLMK